MTQRSDHVGCLVHVRALTRLVKSGWGYEGLGGAVIALVINKVQVQSELKNFNHRACFSFDSEPVQ